MIASLELVESSSRSSFLFVRDLFRKPVPTFRDHALGRRDTQEDKGREGDRQGSAGVEENNRELVHGGLRSLDPTATMLRLIG